MIIYIAILFYIIVIAMSVRLGLHKGIFLLLLAITGIYYSIGGYYYWTVIRDRFFVGVYWGYELDLSVILFATAVLITSTFYFLSIKNFRIVEGNIKVSFENTPASFYFFLIIGFISCLYVFLDKNNRGSFFLIAYQFSDLVIPALIFGIALSPQKNNYKLMVLLFLIYAIFVGFRYKLVLMFFPLLMIMYVNSSNAKKVLLTVFGPVAVLSLFSLITLTRVKFSGLNLSDVSGFDFDTLMYGFFAEANILFGVSSIITYVEPNGSFVYFQPFFDSILELIPKFIYGDREVATQIVNVLEGFQTEEGFNSATTYPYFGEYINMFGYTGYVIGCMLVGLLVASFVKRMYSKSDYMTSFGGVALIAVIFGYYYVSRGYLPQFTKALIFILWPYYIMLRQYEGNIRRLTS